MNKIRKIVLLSALLLCVSSIAYGASKNESPATFSAQSYRAPSVGITSSSAQVLDCYSKAVSMGSSSTYQSPDWEISFMKMRPEDNGDDITMTPNPFMDINGDGLVDYVFYDIFTYSDNIYVSCVYLNNGHGFDPVNRCIANTSDELYYGDCAG